MSPVPAVWVKPSLGSCPAVVLLVLYPQRAFHLLPSSADCRGVMRGEAWLLLVPTVWGPCCPPCTRAIRARRQHLWSVSFFDLFFTSLKNMQAGKKTNKTPVGLVLLRDFVSFS